MSGADAVLVAIKRTNAQKNLTFVKREVQMFELKPFAVAAPPA
jgi:hypothetical protein